VKASRVLGIAVAAMLLFGGLVAAWHARRATPASPPYAKWRLLAPALSPHRESASAVIGGLLFVFGGHYNARVQSSSTVQVLNPASNAWTRRAPEPRPTTHWNAAVDGGTVWLAGGFVGDHPGTATADVWRYDVAADRWSKGPSLPEPRGGGVLFIANHALHYTGGFLPDRMTNSADHWQLSLDGSSHWTPKAPLPRPRGQLSGGVIDGGFYAIGGQFGHDQGPYDLTLVHRYDIATDQWTEAAPLPHPVSHAESSTFVMDGRVIVVGGRNHQEPRTSNRRLLSSVLLYDPPRDLWIALDKLPGGLTGPAAALVGSDLIVSAGGQGPREIPIAATWALPFRDVWRPRRMLPIALAEVAAGIVGRHVYVVGKGVNETLRYDLSSGTWDSTRAVSPRPFVGDHHAAEVLQGRLYLLGGIHAEGRTQIYDPSTNRWQLGAPMPFAGASSASAVIGGLIYVAGGIVGDSTTAQAAAYDPASDFWRRIAPMPAGRNHAAPGTDGHRFFVFGGRSGRNSVSNGFDDVQIYDPTTDRWSTSADSGARIAPLPQARGGMGKAVYLAGSFYVFGGETHDGPGATAQGVYARVDIYDVQRNTWRRGRDMPLPRHGIFPVEAGGRIFLAGGGTAAGRSASSAFDYYTPPAPPALSETTINAEAARTPGAPRPATDSRR
jgi:N-acetylneuraminic acid mutarotase